MSAYYSTTIRIAGTADDVARFHDEVLKDEGERPSDRFEFKTLATQQDGRVVALEYTAGNSRRRPAVWEFAWSGDAAAIPVITQFNKYYEQGDAEFSIFQGYDKLFVRDDVYLLEDRGDEPSVLEDIDTCFVEVVKQKFGLDLILN